MSLRTNVSLFALQPIYPPRPLQFSILLLILLISIPCFIFVLYHFLTDRTLRSALNNHVIILLLISNGIQTVTDVPMNLAYYFVGVIWPPSVHYCFVRYFLDYYLFTTCFSVADMGLDRATCLDLPDPVLQQSSSTLAWPLPASDMLLDVSVGVLRRVFLLLSL